MRKEPSVDLPRSVAGANLTAGRADLSDGASLSGHERNHLFLNDGRGELEDVSGLSGLDDPADGRAVGWLDYDRDGWLDFAVVNANEPTLQLYRNELQNLAPAAKNGSIAIRLVGGNRSASPSTEWSNRDGVGSRLEIDVDDRLLVRELRAGEGFAAQNSATLYAGIGEAPKTDEIRVRWPSGRKQSIDGIPSGTLVTFYENPEHSPTGSEVEIQQLAASRQSGEGVAPYLPSREKLDLSDSGGDSEAPLRVFTTTATWCEACRSELPDVARLREQFPPSALDLIAVPIDETDTPEKLREYTRRHEPSYRMLYDRSEPNVKRVKDLIGKTLRRDVLPASIVTNQENQVLAVFWGLPTVSDIRALRRPADEN